MANLLSATVQVKDPEKLKVYVSQVGATMAPHGGKMVARGKVAKQLSGEVKHQIEALFEFPSAEAIDAWYASEAYQALIPNRDEAAYVTIVVLNPF
ncbi:MAG: DUF1330 domain-containing protein [Myxococcota bacterium]|nr:DUF1330 domain-containing protein [Myxococcota bacterium]